MSDPYLDHSEAIEAFGTAILTPLHDDDWGWGKKMEIEPDDQDRPAPRPL